MAATRSVRLGEIVLRETESQFRRECISDQKGPSSPQAGFACLRSERRRADDRVCQFQGAVRGGVQVLRTALRRGARTDFHYGGSPMADQVPRDWLDKVMHGSVTVGGQVLMGGDVAPEQYEAPTGFSLSLNMNERDRRRTDLQRARGRRPRGHAAGTDVLGRALRCGRRSLRNPVADQLRSVAAASVGAERELSEQDRSRTCPVVSGVDVRRGRYWTIRCTLFRRTRAPQGQFAGPAILMWNASSGRVAGATPPVC